MELIRTPSFSGEEGAAAHVVNTFLLKHGVDATMVGNNVVAEHHTARADAPTLLLNSHLDTVRPGTSWTRDPFEPSIQDGVLYGLGSNDAGGALVMMASAFLHLRQFKDLSHNIMFAATAEEEISGANGMALLAPKVDIAIVGEPTQMNMAIAERGLIVLDCEARGKTGHAARGEGVNALYAAMPDIEWFRTFEFERVSEQLGRVSMTVTQINSGSQHNVVPDSCTFVVDVRTTDAYTNEEVVEIIKQHVICSVAPRSLRLRPSSIDATHPFVVAGKGLGMSTYGSPTMSDQCLLPPNTPSLKIGPGDSARSHTPDEYIKLSEVDEGIALMNTLLERYLR